MILDNSYSDIWKKFIDSFKISSVSLKDRSQTGKKMFSLSKKYWRDLHSLVDVDLQTIFDYVKNIPYVEDNIGTEVIARPKYLLDPNIFPGLDCKKKAILIGSWAEAHSIPYRYLAVSEKKDGVIHHVFPQLFLENEWKIVDATYPQYQLFGLKDFISNGEELPQ